MYATRSDHEGALPVIVLSFAFVIAAAVLLLVGLLGHGVVVIYLSIAASVIAALLLLAGLLTTNRDAEEGAPANEVVPEALEPEASATEARDTASDAAASVSVIDPVDETALIERVPAVKVLAPVEPSAGSASSAGRTPTNDPEVTVVSGRPRYHTAECRFVARVPEAEPIPLSEAIEVGFIPCAVCKPTGSITSVPAGLDEGIGARETIASKSSTPAEPDERAEPVDATVTRPAEPVAVAAGTAPPTKPPRVGARRADTPPAQSPPEKAPPVQAPPEKAARSTSARRAAASAPPRERPAAIPAKKAGRPAKAVTNGRASKAVVVAPSTQAPTESPRIASKRASTPQARVSGTAPVRTAPTKAAPAKAAPVKRTPAKTAPAKTAPARTAPVEPAPVKRTSTPAAPTATARKRAAAQVTTAEAAPVKASKAGKAVAATTSARPAAKAPTPPATKKAAATKRPR